jgi:hypothetical protein
LKQREIAKVIFAGRVTQHCSLLVFPLYLPINRQLDAARCARKAIIQLIHKFRILHFKNYLVAVRIRPVIVRNMFIKTNKSPLNAEALG